MNRTALGSLACVITVGLATPAQAASGPDEGSPFAGLAVVGVQLLVALGGAATAIGSGVALAAEPSVGWSVASFVLGAANLTMGGVVLGIADDKAYAIGTGVAHFAIGALNVGLGIAHLVVEDAPEVAITTVVDASGVQVPMLGVRGSF